MGCDNVVEMISYCVVCMWVKAASDTSKSTINYIQTMAKYYAFRLLVCDGYVGSKALCIPGGLILYLFKQLLEER